MAVASPSAGAFARLSASDLINLAAELPTAPMHMGAVAILDGAPLCDEYGRLRLAGLRAQIDRRLAVVPRLRQVVHPTGPLGGRPVWTDDPAFRIERHIDAVALPAHDGDSEEALLRLAARLLVTPLDRAYPLWRMWFVTGLPQGRVGLVVAIHHVLADGSATVRMLGALLSEAAAIPPDAPEPPPTWPALVRDNVRSRVADLSGRRHRPPRTRVRAGGLLRGLVDAWHAPRTSLNAPVGPHRRLAVLRMDLTEAKRMAHAHQGTVNDLVLTLAAGGLRELLCRRGEPVAGLRLHCAVAVSLRASGDAGSAGNSTGAMIVRLPVYEPRPEVRLGLVAAETARTKRDQSAAGGTALLVWLSRLGLLRYVSRHQHMTNLHASNVIGPPTPIRILGAPVLDLIPVSVLSGNIGVAFLAFSYARRLSITVLTDADRYPDLPVLMTAMRREWHTLTGQR